MILKIKFKRKDMVFFFILTRNSLPLRPGLNYAVVLYNDFRGNLFRTMCNSVTGPCGIKSFKIPTACDVWFSRYRSSNMKLAIYSSLVLGFINFCGRCIRKGLFLSRGTSEIRIMAIVSKNDQLLASSHNWTQSLHDVSSEYGPLTRYV